MILNELSLLNFKNIAQANLVFSPKINCIIGDNGVGKTNLLDAIYYLSFCKSFFNSTDSQILQHGQEMMLVKGDYVRKGDKETIHFGFQTKQRKHFKRNNKEYPKLAEHIGLLPLVMVSPSDTRLVTEGSDERRKYMNGVISQYDQNYLQQVLKYNKLLSQRNTLLKAMHSPAQVDQTLFEVMDFQMNNLAQSICNYRQQFIDELIPVFHELYTFIAGEEETVSLKYTSHVLQGDFENQLKACFGKDIQLGYSTRGVHKDELQLLLNDYPIKREGSQGQRKSYLIALKLAQYRFIQKVNDLNPILLLDDVFDKLDAKRVEQIIKLVSDDNYGQIFITDTNREHLLDILNKINKPYRIFLARNGHIENSED